MFLYSFFKHGSKGLSNESKNFLLFLFSDIPLAYRGCGKNYLFDKQNVFSIKIKWAQD
jgi:hypothetical protein